MIVYYLNEKNGYGLHTIVRTWGGNMGRARPEDLGEVELSAAYSTIEIDALVNRKLCAELSRGWMPRPTRDPLTEFDTPPPYFVNDAGQLCLSDGALLPVVVDPHKDVVDAYPTTFAAQVQAKNQLTLTKLLDENAIIPERTIDDVQADLDELKNVVNSIIARNNLAEWKG